MKNDEYVLDWQQQEKSADRIRDAIRSMEQHRRDTLLAIEGISSVSEENAASISAVNDSLKKQMEIVDNLHDSMKELEEKAETLNDAVNAFRL